jgi:hypothetical protein
VLGVVLVGIVGMRVEVLKLGSTVGAEMQQASQLQSANAVMSNQASALSGNQRIEQLAARYGMVMPGPMDIHFVQASSGANVAKAISGLSEPSPANFLTSVQAERAKDLLSASTAANESAVGVLGADDTPGAVGTVSSTATTIAPASADTVDPASTNSVDPAATESATPPPATTVSPTSDPSTSDSAGVTDANGAASLAG